jgi:XTP/dITP diphosphohydrolase
MSAGSRQRVIVASTNHGKLAEIRAALDFESFEFVTAADLGLEPLEVEETGDTFAENALLKAHAYVDAFGLAALADDSGLEVDALLGAPGVISARYSGEGATDERNNEKMLGALSDVPERDRTARFRSVIALVYPNGTSLMADGSCEGSIGLAPRGSGGFGYDPLFLPEATPGRTMAELEMAEKNAISHRGSALRALRHKLVAEGRG